MILKHRTLCTQGHRPEPQASTYHRGMITCLLLVSCAPAMGAPVLNDTRLTVATHTAGLDAPTGFAFIGQNELFVIEKATGRVKRVVNGVVTGTVLDVDVTHNSERGLLGIAAHPDFDTKPFVYLYFSANNAGSDSSSNSTWTENRLSRFTWNGSVLDPASQVPLLRFANDPAQSNGPNHDGGPLVFGSNGKLFGTTGDLNRRRAEQNRQNQADVSAKVGGIYRLEAPGDVTDGADAADNPFINHPNADFRKWFAYGVRNTFGVAFDPVTGALWDTENGPGTFDEINLVAPGFNSGWSPIMGPDARDLMDAPGDLVVLPNSSYSDPEFSFLGTIGITDLAFLADFTFDARYHDAVIFGGSNGRNAGRLHVLRLNAARNGFDVSGLPAGLTDLVTDTNMELDELTFGSGFGVVTDIQIGPDRALYVLSLNGALYRIVPDPTTITCLLGIGLVCAGRRDRSSARM